MRIVPQEFRFFSRFFLPLYCLHTKTFWVTVRLCVCIYVYLNVRVCDHKVCECNCERLCVRSPFGPVPHPSTSHCLMSASDTCCLSFLTLSQTTKSQQNPAKDCEIFSFKNEWKVPPTHTALLNIITPRIAKFCQNRPIQKPAEERKIGQTLSALCMFSFDPCSFLL